MNDGMILQTVELGTVSPHPSNVRQGDIGAISESLRVHGQYRPIVVQKSTGYILAGNHTWRAAEALGWAHVSVVMVDVDDDEALRILLVDNRANDLATYDDFGLSGLLQQLLGSERELEGTGYTADDLDQLLQDIDSEPIPPDEFPSFDETTPTEHECPKCHYRWSGGK